jgi:ribosome-associated heat shock protein Hsp15
MATIRIDKLLWFLRFAKTRGLAQDWAAAGHIRVNQRRVERASLCVAAGDVLVLPLPRGVLVIELVQIPLRRGPASEAQSCYRVLDGAPANPIAGAAIEHAKLGDPQP